MTEEYLRDLFPVRSAICSQYVPAIYKNHTRDLDKVPIPAGPWASHFTTNHSIWKKVPTHNQSKTCVQHFYPDVRFYKKNSAFS